MYGQGGVKSIQIRYLDILGIFIVFVAVDGRVCGAVAVADSIKESAAVAVRTLHERGLRTVLLTGDNPAVAAAVAAEVGIDEVIAEVMPEAEVLAQRDYDQVIINLGTNDALRRTAPAETKEQLTKIVGLFPDADCIHFVNINTHITDDGDPRKSEAEQVNAIIDEVADKAGADVIDWDGIVAPTVGDDGKSSIIADTVHPKDVGEAKLANAIGDALDRCGRPWKFW